MFIRYTYWLLEQSSHFGRGTLTCALSSLTSDFVLLSNMRTQYGSVISRCIIETIEFDLCLPVSKNGLINVLFAYTRQTCFIGYNATI